METFTLYLKLAGLTLAASGAILLLGTLIDMLTSRARSVRREGEAQFLEPRDWDRRP
jgi:hypothetical protein